jgi:hypothetical protein
MPAKPWPRAENAGPTRTRVITKARSACFPNISESWENDLKEIVKESGGLI